MRALDVSKQWADRRWPGLARIIRRMAGAIVAVREADADEDCRQATDYVVTITVASGDIACRVRDWSYWKRYHDVTIRSSRPTGAKTELHKLREGYGRWYLYAWSWSSEAIGAWVWLDLNAVRASGILERPWEEYFNKDDSSGFIALPIEALVEAGCVVRAGGEAQKYMLGVIRDPGGAATRCAV